MYKVLVGIILVLSGILGGVYLAQMTHTNTLQNQQSNQNTQTIQTGDVQKTPGITEKNDEESAGSGEVEQTEQNPASTQGTNQTATQTTPNQSTNSIATPTLPTTADTPLVGMNEMLDTEEKFRTYVNKNLGIAVGESTKVQEQFVMKAVNDIIRTRDQVVKNAGTDHYDYYCDQGPKTPDYNKVFEEISNQFPSDSSESILVNKIFLMAEVCGIVTNTNDRVGKIYTYLEHLMFGQGERAAYDQQGNKLRAKQIYANLPETIYVGNLTFKLNDQVMSIGTFSPDVNTSVSTPKDTQAKLLQLIEDDLFIRQMYFVSFEEAERLSFGYELHLPLGTTYIQSACTRPLCTGNKRYLLVGNVKYGIDPKNNQPHDLMHAWNSDRIFQNRIKDDFGLGKKDMTVDEYSIQEITEDMLPVFGAYPIDEDYSLLYIKEPYAIPDATGLGKPVVYMYDHLNRDNAVTLMPQKESYQFTYLEPLFSHDTTWNVSLNNGAIMVEDKKYPYLYYKMSATDYVYNDVGWIMQGEQVAQQLEKALDHMQFTAQEKQDFLEYWGHRFTSGQEYFVSFSFADHLDTYVPLSFAITPDTLFRVMMESAEITPENATYYHDKKIYSIQDFSWLPTYTRSGLFDVLEWGGAYRGVNNEWILHPGYDT